jgi:serine/threonine protein kinase
LWCIHSYLFTNDGCLHRDFLHYRGFSTIYLVEQHGSKKKFAMKKMICHGLEDQKVAIQEVEYHNMLKHPNILPCLAYTLTDKGVDPLSPSATIVYMLLPLYSVSVYNISIWLLAGIPPLRTTLVRFFSTEPSTET